MATYHSPNFCGTLEMKVEQEKPDGSLWSVNFWLHNREIFDAKKYFRTEAEARAYGCEQLERQG